METKDLPKNPIAVTIKMVGCRWKVMIVAELLEGTKRFSEISALVYCNINFIFAFYVSS